MRWCAVLFLFSLFLGPRVFSQEQERKLVDRLLRPDMEMQNKAQNKKFEADKTSINKQATVGAFYLQKESEPKQFSQTRDFSSWEYSARPFQNVNRQANTNSQRQIVNSDTRYPTARAMSTGGTTDSNKSVDGQAFAGQRTFLGKGKSQKALNQKNKPLTIEEVRELLNKNK